MRVVNKRILSQTACQPTDKTIVSSAIYFRPDKGLTTLLFLRRVPAPLIVRSNLSAEEPQGDIVLPRLSLAIHWHLASD